MTGKTAIVTDSNSGITQKMAGEIGVSVVPMPFVIDGETFYEDINLSQKEFYEKLQSSAKISTSQPMVGELLKLWDSLLETHDSLVYIPMSSGLSGSCATAAALAEDYGGRVEVVNNQRISVPQRQSVLDALELAKAGKTAAEIREILEKEKFESSIYIMLETLEYLKKGGRITPAAAAVATVLHIRPVLQIQGEKLDAYAKTRSEKQGRAIMMDALKKDIDTRFGGMDQVRIYVAHTDREEEAKEFSQMIEAEWGIPVTYCDPLSLSVACHTGPGALGVGCAKRIDQYL